MNCLLHKYITTHKLSVSHTPTQTHDTYTLHHNHSHNPQHVFSMYGSIYISIYVSIYLSTYLCVYSMYVAIYLSMYLSKYPYICYIGYTYTCICLSIHQSIDQSTHLCTYLCVFLASCTFLTTYLLNLSVHLSTIYNSGAQFVSSSPNADFWTRDIAKAFGKALLGLHHDSPAVAAQFDSSTRYIEQSNNGDNQSINDGQEGETEGKEDLRAPTTTTATGAQGEMDG